MEPLVLSDGTPVWLQELILKLEESEPVGEKALIYALIVLMYETGFYIENTDCNNTSSFNIALMKKLPTLISLVKNNGNYKLHFSLNNSNYSTVFVVVPIDSVIIVNLMIPDIKTISISLKIADFVVDESCPSAITLKSTKHLSTLFKNFIHVMKAFILNEQYNCHNILDLPVEILFLICKYLRPTEFVNFGKTCKKVNDFLEQEDIWKTISRIYLPSRKRQSSETWRRFVKYQYAMERRMNNAKANAVFSPMYCGSPCGATFSRYNII